MQKLSNKRGLIKTTLLCLLVINSFMQAVDKVDKAVLPDWQRPIGLRDLLGWDRHLTGQNVSTGLVELSQQVAKNHATNAFLPDFSHNAFMSIKLRYIYYYHNPHIVLHVSEHAEVIAGLLFGRDKQADWDKWQKFTYQGILPDATVDLYEANWFIYKRLLDAQAKPVNDDIISISWGTNADDVVTMWWQRAMDSLAARQGITVVAACGNGEDEFNSITKPSWGYNVISVGAAQNLGKLPDSLAYIGPPVMEYSSFGPTSDGRAKPDIIAPGLCLGPAGKDKYNCTGTETGYSSFAAPQVTGAAGILIDAARSHNMVTADDPRVIKALLLNGANKLVGWHKGAVSLIDDHTVPLDYCQGAGLVNVWNSYRQLMAGRYSQDKNKNLTNTGGTNANKANTDIVNVDRVNTGWDLAQITTASSSPKARKVYYLPLPLRKDTAFKATLCWYRHYKNNRLFTPELLVNLVLELWSVDNKGKLLNRLDYSASKLDNVQHIYYKAGSYQKVALVVRIAGNAGKKKQMIQETYGLAFCGNQPNWPGDRMVADLNADGIVDIKDLARFVRVWKQYEDNPEIYSDTVDIIALQEDLNGDGKVNIEDFNIISHQWQRQSVWAIIMSNKQ